MEYKKTLNNFVFIKLDKENESIKLTSGMELFIDLSFDPEKHATVTGTVWGLPSALKYTGQGNEEMPWKCNMELKLGDKVIVYYLSTNFNENETKFMVYDCFDGIYFHNSMSK